MNPLLRLGRELGQLSGCLSSADFARYIGHLAAQTPQVARARSLSPADHAMNGNVTVTLRGQRLVVPLAAMRELLVAHDPTPTFGAVREMYASDVYLRAFKPDLKASTVLDLGSNRGLFLMLAARVLGAKLAIGVEPQAFYDRAFWTLVAANGLPRDGFERVAKFAASTPGPQNITVPEIMQAHGLTTLGFMKCDIEGGEFDVVCNNNAFLEHADNIAMELHPDEGDVTHVVAALENFQFEVLICDQFGKAAPPARGHYLYASRTGALLNSR